MAEEKNTESFALGLIVAAIIYFLLRREWGKFSMAGNRASAASGETFSSASATNTSSSTGAGASCCGGSGGSNPAPAVNPGISLGGQSYSPSAESFAPSSVVAQPKIIWTS